jgi:hypothetical protein
MWLHNDNDTSPMCVLRTYEAEEPVRRHTSRYSELPAGEAKPFPAHLGNPVSFLSFLAPIAKRDWLILAPENDMRLQSQHAILLE